MDTAGVWRDEATVRRARQQPPRPQQRLLLASYLSFFSLPLIFFQYQASLNDPEDTIFLAAVQVIRSKMHTRKTLDQENSCRQAVAFLRTNSQTQPIPRVPLNKERLGPAFPEYGPEDTWDSWKCTPLGPVTHLSAPALNGSSEWLLATIPEARPWL